MKKNEWVYIDIYAVAFRQHEFTLTCLYISLSLTVCKTGYKTACFSNVQILVNLSHKN